MLNNLSDTIHHRYPHRCDSWKIAPNVKPCMSDEVPRTCGYIWAICPNSLPVSTPFAALPSEVAGPA